jgi:hypothetical protein
MQAKCETGPGGTLPVSCETPRHSSRGRSVLLPSPLLQVTGEVEVAEIVPDENDFSHTKALIDTDHTGVNLTSVEKIVWTGISEMSRSVAVCAWV